MKNAITDPPQVPDNIKNLVDQAHQIFSLKSLFEVIDMDRSAATSTLSQFYEYADGQDIDNYLSILNLLREEITP